MKLENKKLLILGANSETIPLIKGANHLGIKTYVADFMPNSPGKGFAYKALNIDCKDVTGLAKIYRELNLDGVMVGVADRLVVPYAELCEMLDIPVYASVFQANILSNKERFNKVLTEFGLDPIPYVALSDSAFLPEEIEFPVLVKPVDSNSGKGLSVCRSSGLITDAIKNALTHSAGKRVLVERFMECDDLFVYFIIIDGKIEIAAMADRYTMPTIGELGRVCYKAVYPSKYFKKFKDECLSKFQKLITSLGIDFGVLMISAFVEDDKFHFYDPGFRLQGEAPDIHVENTTSISHVQMLAEFALTGKVVNGNKKNNNFLSTLVEGLTLWVLASPGIVSHIEGVDALASLPGILKVVQRLKIGDQVTESMVGTEGQVFLRCYISSLEANLLASIVGFIKSNLVLLDDKDNSMLINIEYFTDGSR